MISRLRTPAIGAGEAVGDRLHALHRDRRAGVERALHRIRAGRLYADDSRARSLRRHRDRDPGDESAAADAHDEQISVGEVIEHLERARSVARDHPVVVVRMEEIRAVTVLYLLHERTETQHVRREHDLGAVAARRLDLRLRRGLRHRDGDLRADRAAGVCDRLGGVPGAHRHDAVRALLRGEAEDRVHRAAGLERARPLEVLGLEEGSCANALAKRAAREQRAFWRCGRRRPRGRARRPRWRRSEHPPEALARLWAGSRSTRARASRRGRSRRQPRASWTASRPSASRGDFGSHVYAKYAMTSACTGMSSWKRCASVPSSACHAGAVDRDMAERQGDEEEEIATGSHALQCLSWGPLGFEPRTSRL